MSSYSYTMTQKAYGKIVFHCCKYPHLAVNGVVIGSISKETQTVQIRDSIPLCHAGIGLSPMLEIALTQVELYCSTKGLSIVGYYHANELLNCTSISDTVQAIASKLVHHCDKACLLMINNTRLTDPEGNHALELYVRKDQSGQWKEQSGSFKLQDGNVVKDTLKLVENKLFEQLVDFDDHLDNVRLDWTNPDINRVMPTPSSGSS